MMASAMGEFLPLTDAHRQALRVFLDVLPDQHDEVVRILGSDKALKRVLRSKTTGLGTQVAHVLSQLPGLECFGSDIPKSADDVPSTNSVPIYEVVRAVALTSVIVNAIRQFMSNHGIKTVKTLAEKLDMGPSTIGYLLAGKLKTVTTELVASFRRIGLDLETLGGVEYLIEGVKLSPEMSAFAQRRLNQILAERSETLNAWTARLGVYRGNISRIINQKVGLVAPKTIEELRAVGLDLAPGLNLSGSANTEENQEAAVEEVATAPEQSETAEQRSQSIEGDEPDEVSAPEPVEPTLQSEPVRETEPSQLDDLSTRIQQAVTTALDPLLKQQLAMSQEILRLRTQLQARPATAAATTILDAIGGTPVDGIPYVLTAEYFQELNVSFARDTILLVRKISQLWRGMLNIVSQMKGDKARAEAREALEGELSECYRALELATFEFPGRLTPLMDAQRGFKEQAAFSEKKKKGR